MTSLVYNQARTDFATAQLNWQTANICMAFTSGNYAPLATHATINDVGAGNLLVRDIALTGKNVVDGICAATIPAFNAYLASYTVIGVLLYVNTGNDGTSRVIYYSDDGIGFPFVPQGFNYLVAFDQTSGGFFEV